MLRLFESWLKVTILVALGVFFQINVGDINTFRQSFEWETRRRNPGAEPCERSRDESRKGRKGWSKGTWRIHQKGRRGGEPVTRCGRETWKNCVVHVHNGLKLGNACTELRGMYTQCLSYQVDIVSGDGNQSWYFRSKAQG